MTDSAQSLDRLQSDLKALHQQALATQAALRQIQTQESASPYAGVVADLPNVVGIEGAAMGGAALILGALAWWYGVRRARRGQELLNNPFVDSGYQPERFGREQVVKVARQGPAQPGSAAVVAPVAAMPPLQPMPPVQPLQPMPVVPEPVSLPPSLSNSQSSPFAAHDPSLEFDPEAAAGEVERVRKSLADKRAARAAQRAYSEPDRIQRHRGQVLVDLLLDDAPGASAARDVDAQAQTEVEVEVPYPAGAEHEFAADVVLSDDVYSHDLVVDADLPSLGVEQPSPVAVQPAVAALAHGDAPICADDRGAQESPPDFQNTPIQDQAPEPVSVPLAVPDLPPLLSPDQSMGEPAPEPLLEPELAPELALTLEPEPEPEPEPDQAVQFALAQEFEALGLLLEARELATEVLASTDPLLRERAQALLAQLDEQDMARLHDMPLMPDFDGR